MGLSANDLRWRGGAVVAQGGWSVFNTAGSSVEYTNPAANTWLRPGGVGASAAGWPTDEKIERLRAAWFAATDDPRRRNLAGQIQQRPFEFVPYIPTGQYMRRRAFRKNLVGAIDAPIAFL
jgi:peptide/nickel transport system substrate-binding protein